MPSPPGLRADSMPRKPGCSRARVSIRSAVSAYPASSYGSSPAVARIDVKITATYGGAGVLAITATVWLADARRPRPISQREHGARLLDVVLQLRLQRVEP